MIEFSELRSVLFELPLIIDEYFESIPYLKEFVSVFEDINIKFLGHLELGNLACHRYVALSVFSKNKNVKRTRSSIVNKIIVFSIILCLFMVQK